MNQNSLSPIRIVLVAVFLLVAPLRAYSQEEAKKPLEHDAYDIWNRITARSISGDGQWALYSLRPGKGDSLLKIRRLRSRKEYAAKRGASARFSYDSKFAAYLVQPDPEAVKKARRDKKRPEETPKATLVIIELASGKAASIPRVKSFVMPEKAAGWVAFLMEKPAPRPELKTTPDSTKKSEEGASSEKKATEKKKESQAAQKKAKSAQASAGSKPPPETAARETPSPKKEKKKERGTVLVLRNLKSGVEHRYPNAVSYAFCKDGKRLAWAASADDAAADGVFLASLPNAQVKQIAAGRGRYQRLAFDETGKQLAFLSDRDNFEAEESAFSLFLWKSGADVAEAVATADTPGMPRGWWIPSGASPSFSKDGRRLFFNTAPRPKAEPKTEDDGKENAETQEDKEDEEQVKVDIWHWRDPLLQPMQLVQAERERKRSYRAVVHLANGKFVQLAAVETPTVTLADEGNADVALCLSDRPYRKESSWDSPGYQDVYLVDVLSGKRRLVLTKVQSSPRLSPKGNWIYWWDTGELAWYGMSVKQRKPVNLTKAVPHPVHDELHDRPEPPRPYGAAGWLAGDQALLLYDRHDIWSVDPEGGSPPVCVTEQAGRQNDIRFRYVRVDPEARAIDPKQPILLAAFHQGTKASGFYQDRVQGKTAPKKLLLLDEGLQFVAKSRLSNKAIFTRSTFQRFPDLWTSTLDFGDMTRVSEANPQQKAYRWGAAELVEWTSLDGQPLQGILYKPDGFDPASKYPLLVYFYERNSDGLHRHVPPEPSRASINYSFYVSRGYLVFVPDITYKVGHPGQSAVNAILPGVSSLVNEGFVKEDAIGVQGHSWGGYQVAHLVTRTNMFAAAEAGAPVSNMTSAYGGIRWSSGRSRMWQYEKSQSRIGGTLWDAHQKYIENSPLFVADQIQTPLLILHNDKDGAVPWYQGIELFVALRRLSRPAWLLNYNDEAHGLTKKQNQRDWAIRLQQFFDHYLKGARAPEWLAEGVPAVEKGKTLGLELIETQKKEPQ